MNAICFINQTSCEIARTEWSGILGILSFMAGGPPWVYTYALTAEGGRVSRMGYCGFDDSEDECFYCRWIFFHEPSPVADTSLPPECSSRFTNCKRHAGLKMLTNSQMPCRRIRSHLRMISMAISLLLQCGHRSSGGWRDGSYR